MVESNIDSVLYAKWDGIATAFRSAITKARYCMNANKYKIGLSMYGYCMSLDDDESYSEYLKNVDQAIASLQFARGLLLEAESLRKMIIIGKIGE